MKILVFGVPIIEKIFLKHYGLDESTWFRHGNKKLNNNSYKNLELFEKNYTKFEKFSKLATSCSNFQK